MHIAEFAVIAALSAVLADAQAISTASASSSAPASADTCVTITSTNGPNCPTHLPCAMADCLLLSTITLSCGCPSIYTVSQCLTTCLRGCETAYDTIYIPCAKSLPSSIFTGSSIASESSTASSLLSSSSTLTGVMSQSIGSTSSSSSSLPLGSTMTSLTLQGVGSTPTTTITSSVAVSANHANRLRLSIGENLVAGIFAAALGLL